MKGNPISLDVERISRRPEFTWFPLPPIGILRGPSVLQAERAVGTDRRLLFISCSNSRITFREPGRTFTGRGLRIEYRQFEPNGLKHQGLLLELDTPIFVYGEVGNREEVRFVSVEYVLLGIPHRWIGASEDLPPIPFAT